MMMMNQLAKLFSYIIYQQKMTSEMVPENDIKNDTKKSDQKMTSKMIQKIRSKSNKNQF